MGIADSLHCDIKLKATCLTEEMNFKYQNTLDDLMLKMAKSNNIYSFLEFYAGVFLPKEAPTEWTETLERRIDAESIF